MSDHVEAYPLSWPAGYPRTKRPKRSIFKTSEATARDGLLEELRRLGARQPIISTDVETYTRGGRQIPYANQTVEDKGVAVYFTYEGEQRVLACDRWDRLGDNMQAIRKTVEALRGLDRWGVSEILSRTFAGFKALPEAGAGTGEAWWEVLGVPADASQDTIRRAYRTKMHEAHPDKPSGSRERFDRVQDAYLQSRQVQAVA